MILSIYKAMRIDHCQSDENQPANIYQQKSHLLAYLLIALLVAFASVLTVQQSVASSFGSFTATEVPGCSDGKAVAQAGD